MNELSVVVPCLSTIAPVSKFIDDIAQYLRENPSDIDIIVVANETDEDPELLLRFVQEKYSWIKFEFLLRTGGARSYGALARFGIAYSTSRYVVLVSAYGEDDLSIIPKMLAKIREGSQVVQATRYASNNGARFVSFRFKLYQKVYRSLTRLLLGVSISDSTYGFKMFDRPFLLALGLTSNGYSISPEITLKCILANGRVDSVASVVKTSPLNKDFKLFREGFGYLWLLLRGTAHRCGLLWF